MISGAYKTGILVKRYASVSDGMGGFTNTYSTSSTISGHIRTMSGEERMSADKQTLYATNRLYCDSADITEKDRVVDGSTTYEVKFVDPKLDLDNTVRFMQVDLLKIE